MNNMKNLAKLKGTVSEKLVYSHDVFGEKFYTTKIATTRKSGVVDYVPVMVSDRLMDNIASIYGKNVTITGNFRSYNKREGDKNRLILNVFASELIVNEEPVEGEDIDEIFIDGFITKEPIYRKTPQGREIADLLVAVNRAYGKSDYIPCICWGRNARYGGNITVGTKMSITGRIQSREYQKKISETEVENRLAFEVSVAKIDIADD